MEVEANRKTTALFFCSPKAVVGMLAISGTTHSPERPDVVLWKLEANARSLYKALMIAS